MIVERLNLLTGKRNTMELDVTQEQLDIWLNGTPIQIVFPNLNPTEREFLISGMSAEEQKEIFGW